MGVGRAVGLVILSLVDALVPTALAFGMAFLSALYWREHLVDPLRVAAGAAAVAFVGTLTVGTVSYLSGHGPFPATKAAKRVFRVWTWI